MWTVFRNRNLTNGVYYWWYVRGKTGGYRDRRKGRRRNDKRYCEARGQYFQWILTRSPGTNEYEDTEAYTLSDANARESRVRIKGIPSGWKSYKIFERSYIEVNCLIDLITLTEKNTFCVVDSRRRVNSEFRPSRVITRAHTQTRVTYSTQTGVWTNTVNINHTTISLFIV